MLSQAHFNYRVANDLIVIEDILGTVSVTMDAERVLADIQKELGSLEGKYIIWKDAEGTWDALEWYNNQIRMFPLGCKSLEEAIITLRKHLNEGRTHWSQQDNDQIQKQSNENKLRQY